MDVKQALYEWLTSRGCTFYEEVGILFVTTPDGVVWDMTVPEVSDSVGKCCHRHHPEPPIKED